MIFYPDGTQLPALHFGNLDDGADQGDCMYGAPYGNGGCECLAEKGQYHLCECETARCPRCWDQLIGCRCRAIDLRKPSQRSIDRYLEERRRLLWNSDRPFPPNFSDPAVQAQLYEMEVAANANADFDPFPDAPTIGQVR